MPCRKSELKMDCPQPASSSSCSMVTAAMSRCLGSWTGALLCKALISHEQKTLQFTAVGFFLQM